MRTYLITHEEERGIILTPRVDRIQGVKVLADPVKPMPDEFDIGQFYSLSHKMYTGPESEVSLICDNTLIDHVLDCFGKDFVCSHMRERL